jgi:hypothetical protein
MPRLDHSALEWQILEGMQSVVMDENTDWALHRKQVRRVFNRLAQFIPSRLLRVIVSAQTTTAGRFLVRASAWRDIDSCRDAGQRVSTFGRILLSTCSCDLSFNKKLLGSS